MTATDAYRICAIPIGEDETLVATTGLADESVALAISFDALMFMRAGPVVKEVARILRPGGFFAFTVAEWISGRPGRRSPPSSATYAPLLEANGLTVIQEMTLDPDRGLPLYRGLLARETELRAEMGPPAETLLSQAREHLERAGRRRVRDVFFIARRPKESARLAAVLARRDDGAELSPEGSLRTSPNGAHLPG
jgi:SAM-dependent methyltransferase